MTNEELQEWGRKFLDDPMMVHRHVRSLVSQAYEEAARAVQAQCAAKGTGCLAHCTHPESVQVIRALKQSLESVPA